MPERFPSGVSEIVWSQRHRSDPGGSQLCDRVKQDFKGPNFAPRPEMLRQEFDFLTGEANRLPDRSTVPLVKHSWTVARTFRRRPSVLVQNNFERAGC